MTATVGGCPCGEVHQMALDAYEAFERVTAGLPATVKLVAMGGAWLVPRLYIACHRIRAVDVPGLAERYGWEAVRD